MFKITFYWLYNFLSRNKTDKKQQLNSALLILCLLQGFNIITIYGLINYYYFHYKMSHNGTTYSGISLMIILAVSNYIFIYRNKYEIINKYDSYPINKRKIQKMLALLYVFLSIIIFFVGGASFQVQNN